MAHLTKSALLGAPLVAALDTAGATTVQAETAAAACIAKTSLSMTVASGPFNPTVESLKTYQTPDWFRG